EASHHFSSSTDPVTGHRLTCLIGHTRTSLRDDLFFVEEIQSDWAQSGRSQDWQHIDKAPFLSNTEAWSGLLLRGQMQRVAENPDVKRFAWILGSMSNGWGDAHRTGVSAEEAANASGGLNDFYVKILPKLADKVLKGTGEKVKFIPVQFQEGGAEC